MAQKPSLRPLRIVVLISGNGSNLQAIIDASQKDLPVEICAVISNRPDAYGLQRAANAHIPHHVIDHTQYPDRESFDRALGDTIDRYQPELIVLAGFMRVLTDRFVRHYHGRMLNIHPSLLPKYRGLNTHAKALAAGDKEHGASVHFVTETLDGGPVVVQASVPILATDTVKSLAQRVQQLEHKIYVATLRWLSEGRLAWRDGEVMLDGKTLSKPLLYNSDTSDAAKTA